MQKHYLCQLSLLTLFGGGFCLLSLTDHCQAQVEPAVPQPILIWLDPDQQLHVTSVATRSLHLNSESQGIVVWSQGDREGWNYIPPGGKWTLPGNRPHSPNPESQFYVSRGRNGDSSDESGVMITAQLDQILTQTVVRGNTFLTPHSGYVLTPKVTIRRTPRQDQIKFPTATAHLLKDGKMLAEIPFAEGQQEIAWEQIPKLAQVMPQGLPPGEYYLKLQGEAASSLFTIEDPDWRQEVMKLPDRLAELTGNRSNPLYLQMTIEHFLDQRDENNKPIPYLTDAWELLADVPEQRLTAHVKEIKRQLLQRLSGNKVETPKHTLDVTGIEVIDQARQLIIAGQWNQARELLHLDKLPNDPRTQALGTLYQAVILAESGAGTEDQTLAAFAAAIEQLVDGTAADQYLARSNLTNHLLSRCQDRLYNHAFQMATGGPLPILTTLSDWQHAAQQSQSTLQLAAELNDSQRAAALVNHARLYVLLADIIRTLDTTLEGEQHFTAGAESAAEMARKYAFQAATAGKAEPLLLAPAESLQAHLAFRARRYEDCLQHAEHALSLYLEVGSLTGVEGVQRLLGLYYLRAESTEPDQQVTSAARQQALNHFQLSSELTEVLRERIPADQIGLSQAGFFARRAYVNEKLIELLIAENKPNQALHYAELASARSLQDLLAADGTAKSWGGNPEQSVEEILTQWPADNKTIALKYFIGSDHVWLFLIDTQGQVQAYDLLGKEQTAREFVADVRQFLTGVEGQAGKMRRRLLSGEGFDHSWQQRLHEFYHILMPGDVPTRLKSAETVIVVPHHILHYFPFAALVTELDSRDRDSYEMVHPRFLIDEPIQLSYAPSLHVWHTLTSQPPTPLKEVNAVGIVTFPDAPALPGVETDLKNLSSVFGTHVRHILAEHEAGESEVKQLLSRSGLLLLATHGTNIADRPLESYLMMRSDGVSDGRLTARELFSIRVRTDMVVMSACYSGLADRSPLPGDDLFGIQRAFLQSGSHTLVAGLWDVYDSTGPELMNVFFVRLARGASAASALAESQRAFLKQRRATDDDPWLHPYFWAVYTVSGDHRTSFSQP